MTAKEKLLEIMNTRKWYRDLIEPRKANTYKVKLKRGGLCYEKTRELLKLLGVEPKQEEIW